jgi:hypothetical protein
VQVHYDEGVAIYIGPEPCVGVREDGGEASVGEGIGQPLSREKHEPQNPADWDCLSRAMRARTLATGLFLAEGARQRYLPTRRRSVSIGGSKTSRWSLRQSR